jgi:hypothetical protein
MIVKLTDGEIFFSFYKKVLKILFSSLILGYCGLLVLFIEIIVTYHDLSINSIMFYCGTAIIILIISLITEIAVRDWVELENPSSFINRLILHPGIADPNIIVRNLYIINIENRTNLQIRVDRGRMYLTLDIFIPISMQKDSNNVETIGNIIENEIQYRSKVQSKDNTSEINQELKILKWVKLLHESNYQLSKKYTSLGICVGKLTG